MTCMSTVASTHTLVPHSTLACPSTTRGGHTDASWTSVAAMATIITLVECRCGCGRCSGCLCGCCCRRLGRRGSWCRCWGWRRCRHHRQHTRAHANPTSTTHLVAHMVRASAAELQHSRHSSQTNTVVRPQVRLLAATTRCRIRCTRLRCRHHLHKVPTRTRIQARPTAKAQCHICLSVQCGW